MSDTATQNFDFHSSVPQGLRDAVTRVSDLAASKTFERPFESVEDVFLDEVNVYTRTEGGTWNEIVFEGVVENRAEYTARVREAEGGTSPAREIYNEIKAQGIPVPEKMPNVGVTFDSGKVYLRASITKEQYQNL